MADIDFLTDLSSGFRVSLGDNPQIVTGNRALLNRFEITFLTTKKTFNLGGRLVVDNFGGDADKFINQTPVLADIQGISAGVSVAVEQTVKSMKSDDEDNDIKVPDTEKLDRADIISIEIVNDVVVAKIRVYPVEVETAEALMFNLPIIRGV